MPTQAETDDFHAAISDVRTLAVASLVAQWTDVVAPNPAAAVDDLRTLLLDLTAQYGQASAATAIDFYESARPPGSPAFIPTPVVRDDLVQGGTLNWATSPLLGDGWQAALDRTAAELMKSSYQAAVETIGVATEADPLDAKFARWPQNDDPCAWCVLRASRGAVYWSEAAAERGDHLRCKCQVSMIFPGDQLPYLRKPYMAQYLAGAHEAEPASDRKGARKALLAGMRRANGSR